MNDVVQSVRYNRYSDLCANVKRHESLCNHSCYQRRMQRQHGVCIIHAVRYSEGDVHCRLK